MNIAILSVGTRDKVIQYFRRTLAGRGRVIATDMSAAAPALYEADGYYIVPHISADDYLDVILNICKREKICGVLSLIDPELSLLAANEERFTQAGVAVIGSPLVLCERALDKMEMYRWLSAHGYPCAKSYQDRKEFYDDVERGVMRYPVFVKPIRGSASIAIQKVYDRETVELLFAHQKGLMVQEFLNGQEIGADCYIDMVSGEIVSIFLKKKLLMRAGETDKAVSFRDKRLFEQIDRLCRESGFRGPIDIDIFQVNGIDYISEVNPRFGGGYPHAYECGCDFIERIIRNLNGEATEPAIGDYNEGVLMMKYNEVMIRGA